MLVEVAHPLLDIVWSFTYQMIVGGSVGDCEADEQKARGK
jgi:hypothetical protein